MSPSEFDLRGALHDGEGEGIDVEALIGHASAVQRTRHARRVQLASVAALVVLAGGVGTAVALRSPDTRTPTADSAASAGSAGTAGQGSGAATVPKGAPMQAGPAMSNGFDNSVNSGAGGRSDSVALPPCAATLATVPHPTASAIPRPVAMFPGSVSVLRVCGYDGTGKLAHLADGTEVSATYTGADATAITHSIDAARSTKDPAELCPFVEHPVKTLTIAAGGSPVVVAQPYCGGTVSNGATTRYDWTPPSQLVNLINGKQPFN